MFKEFLSKTGITKLLNKVRVGGFTINEYLSQNRVNTKRSLKSLFKQSVLNDALPNTYTDELAKLTKRRRRQTLTTLRNVTAAVRGRVRAIGAGRKKGTWVNNGTLDAGTTEICASHMGKKWAVSYDDIPNKPPRTPPIHPCRSFLTFVRDGDPIPEEVPFMDSFNADENLQRELLGKTKFEAFKQGELKINTFAQFEKVKLTTLDELDLK